MRLSHLIFLAAALGLATMRPVDAEDTVTGPVYIVTYFDVAPTSTQQSAALAREFADASRKEDGNAGFEAFEEIGRPSRFATWRSGATRRPRTRTTRVPLRPHSAISFSR